MKYKSPLFPLPLCESSYLKRLFHWLGALCMILQRLPFPMQQTNSINCYTSVWASLSLNKQLCMGSASWCAAGAANCWLQCMLLLTGHISFLVKRGVCFVTWVRSKVSDSALQPELSFTWWYFLFGFGLFSLALLSGTLLSLECLTMVKNMAPDVYLHWSFYLSTPKKMPESWKPCCKTVQTSVHKSDTYLFMLILKLLTKLCIAPCMLAELLPLVVLCFQNDWERTDTSSGLTLKV